MQCLMLILCAVAQASQPVTIEGTVTDGAGTPLAGALVAAEPVNADALVVVRSDSSGAFRLDNVPPGLTGVFAHASGHAFGGFSVSTAPGQRVENRRIELAPPAQISGKISAFKGKAVEGARVIRVALLGETKVSVPLEKLAAYGFPVPVSEKKGRFVVDSLPQGVPVALKISHADFPIQAVTGITAGDTNVKAELMPGVLVRGNALIRGEDKAVARVDITITNAQPPHETVHVQTDTSGRYTARLKPGIYTFEGKSTSYRSAGMQRVAISGEQYDEKVNLYVLPTGSLTGEVRVATDDTPVAGAKVVIESGGNPAGVAYTGHDGRYRFDGASGVNRVYLAEAPGYAPGETRSMEVAIEGGETYEMPVFWVMPQSTLSLRVIDESGAPAAGAVVTLLNPATFGWIQAGNDGTVSLPLESTPEGGTVAGVVEARDHAAGAMFAMPYGTSEPQTVALKPYGAVQGTVTNGSGDGVGGAVVAGRLADREGRASFVLWQTVTRPDGSFRWNGVLPQVQQQCYVFGDGKAEAVGPAFNVEPGGMVDAGAATVAGPAAGETHFGRTLPWEKLPKVSGTGEAAHPAVVLYAQEADASAAYDALSQALPVITSLGFSAGLVVDGTFAAQGSLPVRSGAAPATATLYVTDADGTVVFESFGLPPLHALQQLNPNR